jgi:hypothetical protein
VTAERDMLLRKAPPLQPCRKACIYLSALLVLLHRDADGPWGLFIECITRLTSLTVACS